MKQLPSGLAQRRATCIRRIDTNELEGGRCGKRVTFLPESNVGFGRPFVSKAGINPSDTYKGHYGTITGLDFHPLHGPVDFSDLYLTSSVDWTVKLWRVKVGVTRL